MIDCTSQEPLHSDSANAATARLWCAEPETRSRRGRLAGCLGQSLIQQLYCLDTAQTGFKQHSWCLQALAETDSYGRQQVGGWPRPALASGPEVQPAWGRTQCQQKACARAGPAECRCTGSSTAQEGRGALSGGPMSRALPTLLQGSGCSWCSQAGWGTAHSHHGGPYSPTVRNAGLHGLARCLLVKLADCPHDPEEASWPQHSSEAQAPPWPGQDLGDSCRWPPVQHGPVPAWWGRQGGIETALRDEGAVPAMPVVQQPHNWSSTGASKSPR